MMLGGKTAVIAGYGDVGKGWQMRLRALSTRVIITEIDSIRAIKRPCDGLQS